MRDEQRFYDLISWKARSLFFTAKKSWRRDHVTKGFLTLLLASVLHFRSGGNVPRRLQRSEGAKEARWDGLSASG